MSPPFEDLNPAQQRVVDELLAWRTPRPPVDHEAGDAVRKRLEERLRPVADLVPVDEQLWLGKSKLDALDCDGRFLDQQQEPFAWSVATLRGRMTHTAVELDHYGNRERRVDEVVAYAWERLATEYGSHAEFLAGIGGVQADDLRGQAVEAVREFRSCFPPLPGEAVEMRAEVAFRVQLCEGKVTLAGRPDFAIGRPQHAGQRRLLLLDIKTGSRRSLLHRADMRFYALLATLKYGVPPFRVATYYLDEAAWEAEDVDDDVLEAALRTVEQKALRAARLEFDPPPEEALRLVPGPACRWCGRAPGCPARAEWEGRDEPEGASYTGAV